MAGRAGDQLVLAIAGRPASSGDGGHGPGVPRHALAMCPLPSSSVREMEPGRLLRSGRLLHAPGPQELWRAPAVLRQRHSDDGRTQSADGPGPRAKIPKRSRRQLHAGGRMAGALRDPPDREPGIKPGFGNVASPARAMDLPHENLGSYFLDPFDRPRRVTSCECERSSGGTLAQVLLLANSDEIENKI